MRILIATNGTPHSQTVVKAGGRLAELNNGLITLFTVIRNEQERSQAALILQQAREWLPANVLVRHCHIRCGQVAEAIVQEAESGYYDLIVMGSQPAHRFWRHTLTTTTERVLTKTPYPVLIVKRDLQQVENLLVCESGRAPTILDKTQIRLPGLVSEMVDYTVLHVMSQIVAAPDVPEWELHASASELISQQTPEGVLLEHDSRLLRQATTHSNVKIRHGMVVDEILAEARNGRYDALVIGRHQRQGWEWLLLDDVAKMLIERLDLPIFVL